MVATAPLEDFPHDVLGDQVQDALLFKKLATLRTDAGVFEDVDELRWRGPRNSFAKMTEKIGDARLLQRVLDLKGGEAGKMTVTSGPRLAN